MKLYGITGWKDQGKTTLVSALVQHFTAAGLTVSTIKHAHHAFDVDQPGRDSHRHREAGAAEVILASRKRFALMHEIRDEAEWELPELIGKLSPVDLVLIEGYKNAPHPKIEVYREDRGRQPIALTNPSIRAVAGAAPGHDLRQPVFPLDDIAAIAAFIRDDAQ
ncbi:molybdopterin-guanine dinucleotide biosynthesis protein B [Algicella marina]|uniref:Molybdopterin-guanine dinucleotide biosynthesis protein B n=1 Tax=Algicella marina TaxID=2683284 RepID=A0A6P1T6V0_9RHOB|nr:molybdopterin-guanine dinucleotide biosynthesis protein B [Algicella marina]QHQ37009.1 molybdopterin-guanine dinucleotide biosynthesis protein B [Algicella marina]